MLDKKIFLPLIMTNKLTDKLNEKNYKDRYNFPMKPKSDNLKKTVVLVISDLTSSGGTSVVLALAEGFKQYNCNISIVVLKEKDSAKYDKMFKIFKFKQHYRWLPRSIRGYILAPVLDRFIIKNCGCPDIILSHSNAVNRILCLSRLKNVFLTVHGIMSYSMSYLSKKEIKKEINIYNKKPLIAVSKGTKDSINNTIKSKFQSFQIYNPINTNFLYKQSNEYMPSISNYLVCVGRLAKVKRHDILIKAYHMSNIKEPLVIVGDGELKKTQALINALNIDKKVILAGFHSNPYPYIKNAKLMILSSESESLSMVILEALALGVPVISTDCESGPSEILPSKNLCPVGDIEKLAKLIKKAADNPAQYQHPLHQKFSLDYATQEYFKLIT